MTIFRLNSSCRRIGHINCHDMKTIIGEPTLVDADFVYAAQRGGELTKSAISVIMGSSEWKSIEESDSFKSEAIVPTITTTVRRRSMGEVRVLPWRNAAVSGESPYYQFFLTISNTRAGIQDIHVIDDQIVFIPKLTESAYDALQNTMNERWVSQPPRATTHSQGEILLFDENTIHRPMAITDYGWLYTFTLTYSTRKPIPQCDVPTESTD